VLQGKKDAEFSICVDISCGYGNLHRCVHIKPAGTKKTGRGGAESW
jgi:hypothetical protein